MRLKSSSWFGSVNNESELGREGKTLGLSKETCSSRWLKQMALCKSTRYRSWLIRLNYWMKLRQMYLLSKSKIAAFICQSISHLTSNPKAHENCVPPCIIRWCYIAIEKGQNEIRKKQMVHFFSINVRKRRTACVN